MLKGHNRWKRLWFQFLFWFFLVLLHSPSTEHLWDIQWWCVFWRLVTVTLQLCLAAMTIFPITLLVTITCQLQRPLPTQTPCTPGFLLWCRDTLCACWPVLAHLLPRALVPSSMVTVDHLCPRNLESLTAIYLLDCNYTFFGKVWTPVWRRSTHLHLPFLEYSAWALGYFIVSIFIVTLLHINNYLL